MGNNSQSRKWALVINNPLEAGLDHGATLVHKGGHAINDDNKP